MGPKKTKRRKSKVVHDHDRKQEENLLNFKVKRGLTSIF